MRSTAPVRAKSATGAAGSVEGGAEAKSIVASRAGSVAGASAEQRARGVVAEAQLERPVDEHVAHRLAVEEHRLAVRLGAPAALHRAQHQVALGHQRPADADEAGAPAAHRQLAERRAEHRLATADAHKQMAAGGSAHPDRSLRA